MEELWKRRQGVWVPAQTHHLSLCSRGFRDLGADTVLCAEIQRLPIEILDHEINAAGRQILDMLFGAGVGLQAVRADVQLRTIHAARGLRHSSSSVSVGWECISCPSQV